MTRAHNTRCFALSSQRVCNHWIRDPFSRRPILSNSNIADGALCHFVWSFWCWITLLHSLLFFNVFRMFYNLLSLILVQSIYCLFKYLELSLFHSVQSLCWLDYFVNFTTDFYDHFDAFLQGKNPIKNPNSQKAKTLIMKHHLLASNHA